MRRRLLMCLGMASTLLLGAANAVAQDIQLLTENWVPYVYPAAEKPNAVEGVGVALVRKVLLGAGIDVEPRVQPWPRSYKMAQKGRNVLIFSMVRLPERETQFTWIGPLVVSPPGVLIYSRKSAPAQPETIAALKSFKVCATPGSNFNVSLRQHGFVPGENLLELQTMFPSTNSSAGTELTLIPPDCQFIASDWPPFIALMRRRGVREPEQSLAFYAAPEGIFGKDMQTWLIASNDFDASARSAIKASYDSLHKSGTLHSICSKEYRFDEKTCLLLKPD